MATAPSTLVTGARSAGPHGSYRIGDAVLEVASDYPLLHEGLAGHFGRLGGSQARRAAVARLRCHATVLPGSSHLLLTFDGPPIPGLVDVATGLFWPIRARRCYVETPCVIPGWRMLVNAERRGRLLVACSARTAVVDLAEAPTDFVLDCLLEVMQALQPGVLFVHGASLGVHGVGAVFIGRTRSGKSTTALSLASRGHAYFGDDVAAIRVSERVLIPFGTSAALRDGPLAETIDAHVEASGHTLHEDPDGTTRRLVQVGDLFPASASTAGPVPLRYAFFLNGFADRPRLEPYEPGLHDLDRLHTMMVSWRPNPGNQLMRFLELLDLFSGVQCFLLEVGPPEETADVIEGVMA